MASSTRSSPDCSGTWRWCATAGVSRSAASSSRFTGSISIAERRRRCQPRDCADLADKPRQVVAGRPAAIATEVDAGEHDLAVALADAPPDLTEYRFGRPAARSAAHLRNDTEGAREAAAVLHLHERAH